MKPVYQESDYDREIKDHTSDPKREPYRHPFHVDHARLIHSPSFRRLQGKTQLFPGESDFFRNRFSHSLEVAQIAKSIARKINHNHFQDSVHDSHKISSDLVEFAALAHDLGHPPFGHNGEMGLNEMMKDVGGFEGNAQTLRILSRIEKKISKAHPPVEFEGLDDRRCGLNLCYRSLASILKYDRQLPPSPGGTKVIKGYYHDDTELVKRIKSAVIGNYEAKKFKTIECQIMDLADDIAYSTYDFEDSLKAGFTSLLDLLSVCWNENLLRRIAFKLWKKDQRDEIPFTAAEIPEALLPKIKETEARVIAVIFALARRLVPDATELASALPNPPPANYRELFLMGHANHSAKKLQEDGYLRTRFTSELVHRFIQGVELDYNKECPPLSKIVIDPLIDTEINVLKFYSYETHIESPRLKMVDTRGRELVKEIFDHLVKDEDNQLLPVDWKTKCEIDKNNEGHRRRCICDFIAGMTDKYAIEFHSRLKFGIGSIYKVM